MVEVVTSLTIDARGAEVGGAAYIRMMNAAQAAVDRVLDSERRGQQAREQAGSSLSRQADSIAKTVQAWDRLRASTDQIAAAEQRAQRAMEQATLTADNAVKRGVASSQEAAAAIERVRRAQEQMIRDARAASVGPVLENAFRGVSQAAQEAVRQSNVAWQNLARGVSEAAKQAVKESNAAWANMARGVSEAAKGIEDLRQKYVPLLAVEQQHRKELAEINALHRAGAITDAQRTTAVDRSTKAFQQHSAAVSGTATTMQRLQPYAANLTAQMNDIGVSLASGQKPWMVLIQQGSQVQGILQQASVSLRSFINPLTVAAAGMLAVGAAFGIGIARANTLDHQLKALNVTLAQTGNASGLNAAGVQRQVIDFARAPGVNRDTAQAAAQGLLSDPLISGDVFARALPLARDFAQVTGQDIPTAAKNLATALTGGYQAAMQLDKSFQFLSVSELDQIRNLEEQGRKADAARVMLAALEKQIKGLADDALTPMAAATNSLGNAWDRLLDSLAKTRLIQGAKEALIDFMTTISEQTGGVDNSMSGQIARLEKAYNLIASGRALVMSQNQRNGRPLLEGTEDASNQLKVMADQYMALVDSMYAAKQAQEGLAASGTTVLDAITVTGEAATKSKGELHELAMSMRQLSEFIDPASRQLELLENKQREATQAFFAGLLPLGRWIEMLGVLGNMKVQVPTPERIVLDAEAEARESRMSPSARARAQADRTAPPQLTGDLRTRYINAKGQAAVGGGGFNLGERIGAIDAEVAATKRIIDAYGQSEEAGRRAELVLKAISQQHKLGADAIAKYTAALEKEDAAKRQIEAAKQLRQLQDEITGQEQLTAALALSTAEYDKQKIAIDAAAKARQGYTPQQVAQFTDLATRQLQDRYRQEAIGLNRQLDPVAQFNDTITKLEKLKETGVLTATAHRAAWEEAYIRMGRAGESWLGGLQAGLMEFARTARSIGDQVAGAFVQAFSAGTDALARMAVGLKADWKGVLIDLRLSLAKAFIGANLTGPLAGLLGGGLGALGGGSIQIGGQTYVPASGGGGLGSLLGGGGIPGLGGGGDIFGLGGFMSRSLWGGPNPLFGAAFAGIPETSLLSMSAADIAASGTGSIGGVLGGLGGILSGVMGFASGNPIGGATGLLGGGLGLLGGLGVLGSWAGPAGMAIGLLGSLLGGLTKKKPKTPQAVSNILVGTDGVLSSELAMSRNAAQLQGSTGKAANDFIKTLNPLLGTYDLGLGPGSMGGWLLNSIGKNTGNQWITGLGKYGSFTPLPGVERTGPADSWSSVQGLGSKDEAIGVLAGLMLRQAAIGGTLQGANATQTTILKNADLKSIEEIKRALDFSVVYGDMERGLENITANEKAHRDLVTQYKAAAAQAQEYGLSIDIIRQRQAEAERKMVTDFNDQTRRALLAINDPDALAREDLQRAQDARRKEADYLNTLSPGLVNFANLISLNNAELVELEKTLGHANDNIRSALDRIKYGDDISSLTVKQRYSEALTEYQALEAKALAGDQTLDKDRLTEIGDLFLQYSRQLYSVTAQNAIDTSRVRRLYEWMLGEGAMPGLPGMATGGIAGPGWLTIGEQGPERIRLHRPAQILSRGDSEGLVSGGREAVALLGQVVERLGNLERRVDGLIGVNAEGVRSARNTERHTGEMAQEARFAGNERRQRHQKRGAA